MLLSSSLCLWLFIQSHSSFSFRFLYLCCNLAPGLGDADMSAHRRTGSCTWQSFCGGNGQLTAIWPWVIEIINSTANDSSPWHWMLLSTSLGAPTQGGCQCQRYFPSTFFRRGKKKWTLIWHDSNILENMFSLRVFSFFCAFCFVSPLWDSGPVAQVSVHDLKDGKRINRGYNIDINPPVGLKYFTPQGLLTHLSSSSMAEA